MSNEVVISRIEKEIEKIDKKESTVYFFIIDTKGNPSGSLSYIYNLALILAKNGYNVGMLYQEDNSDDFIGVGEWLGEEYSAIPHYNLNDGDVSVGASDILFIPELFSNVMMQTKKLPCKRIAILQNYDFMLEQMPISSQWGDLGIMEAIVNTDLNGELIKNVFPYVKTTTIRPFVSKKFGKLDEPKKMIINIVSKNQTDINRIIKPFYWKYPMYKWVSFRDLRGFSQEQFASMLRESAITIWVDDDTTFGYSAIEAMASGSVVIAKTSDRIQEWMLTDDKKGFNDSCVWFDSFDNLHKIIASVVRAWICDKIPEEIEANSTEVVSKYTMENTTKDILTYVNGIFENRKNEMESLITHIKNIENN